MRRSSLIGAGCFALFCLAPASGASDAATIEGRVVDSAGRPVAGAEVRIWQKVFQRGAAADEQVKFDGAGALLTDAAGRFTTPDTLADETFDWIVAQSDGMLAGRSGWIEVGKKASVVADDIVLKRLRAVGGQVLDRQGLPVADTVVFNSGDGHQRVEAKTDAAGKFSLAGVPERTDFLFVEKAGYRFAGMRLPPDMPDAAFTLVSVEEPDEPLPTLGPLLSPEQEIALAREALARWIEKLSLPGDGPQIALLTAWSNVDPLEALQRIDQLADENKHFRDFLYDDCLRKAIARRDRPQLAELVRLIESGDDEAATTREYLAAARHLDTGELSRRHGLLDAALRHARRVDDDAFRTEALALVADALYSSSERERAEPILAEADKLAQSLTENPRSKVALGVLALATVHADASRAVEWLEKTKGTRGRVFPERGRELALRLLPQHPELAENVWNRTLEPDGPWDVPGRRPQPYAFYPEIADFCFRLAAVDRRGAERIADGAEIAAMRVRGRAAIALALLEKQPEEARKLLASLVREKLPRVARDGNSWFGSWSPPGTAAWLLPLAERVSPDLVREIFWRSLAMRLPRSRDHFDFDIEVTDLELIKMLARYDRGIARELLEPFAAQLPQWTRAAATQLTSRQAASVAADAGQMIREVIAAAVHVDPRWANELLDAAVAGTGDAADQAREAFFTVLSLHGARRWQEGNALCAGFWQLRSIDEIKP